MQSPDLILCLSPTSPPKIQTVTPKKASEHGCMMTLSILTSTSIQTVHAETRLQTRNQKSTCKEMQSLDLMLCLSPSSFFFFSFLFVLMLFCFFFSLIWLYSCFLNISSSSSSSSYYSFFSL